MRFKNLFGIDPSPFFDEIWENQLFFGSSALKLKDLSLPIEEWSPEILEKIVRDGDMIMIKDSMYLKQDFFVKNGEVCIDKIYYLWSEGFTFYARNLSLIFEPIAALTKDLEKELFPLFIESNLFLTPKEQTGFSPHFDCHDVFVVQLAGEKHWKFWPAIKQDMDYESPTREDQELVDRFVTKEKPVLEKTLAPGDTLYMPRGAIHGPRSISFSSHLTFWLKAPLESQVLPQDLHQETFRKDVYAATSF